VNDFEGMHLYIKGGQSLWLSTGMAWMDGRSRVL